MSDNVLPKCHYVHLPKEFIKLLKLPSSQITSNFLIETLSLDKGLHMAVKNCFMDFDSQKDLVQVYQQLTWTGFRDRLASVFLYKSLFGKYPKKSDIQTIEECQKFVSEFSSFEANVNSRLFLLGYYLENQKNLNPGMVSLNYAHFDQLKDMLGIMSKKSEKLDLLLITLFYISHFVEREKLIIKLSAYEGFDSIISMLSLEERKMVLSELFSYCASIDEKEFFIPSKVSA